LIKSEAEVEKRKDVVGSVIKTAFREEFEEVALESQRAH